MFLSPYPQKKIPTSCKSMDAGADTDSDTDEDKCSYNVHEPSSHEYADTDADRSNLALTQPNYICFFVGLLVLLPEIRIKTLVCHRKGWCSFKDAVE